MKINLACLFPGSTFLTIQLYEYSFSVMSAGSSFFPLVLNSVLLFLVLYFCNSIFFMGELLYPPSESCFPNILFCSLPFPQAPHLHLQLLLNISTNMSETKQIKNENHCFFFHFKSLLRVQSLTSGTLASSISFIPHMDSITKISVFQNFPERS